MALKKKIELPNGIQVNYHRIVYVNKITNKCNLIQVASYTSEEKRHEEESVSDEAVVDVFVDKDLLRTEYDSDMTIEAAYDLLKSTEKYSGAEDC